MGGHRELCLRVVTKLRESASWDHLESGGGGREIHAAKIKYYKERLEDMQI